MLGAAQSLLWPGPLATVLFSTWVIWLSEKKAGVFQFLVLATFLGSLGDFFVIQLGAYSFIQPFWSPWGYPLWMSSLWLAFAGTFGHSLNRLTKNYWLAALFGALGGPLAYSAGASLGAIEWAQPRWKTACFIGAYWSFILPILFALRNRILNRPSHHEFT